MPLTTPSRERTLLFALAIGLLVVAARTLFPLWPAVLLAVWTAVLGRKPYDRMTRFLRGKQRAAAIFVVLLMLAIATPLVLAGISLAHQAVELVNALAKSEGAKNALAAIASGQDGGAQGDGGVPSLGEIVRLAREHGAQALGLVRGIAGAAVNVIVGVFVYFATAYALLVDGPGYYTWLESRLPIPAKATRRFAGAIAETGRGLLVGVGLTGLTQGVVATIAYLVLGVPRALVLGFLTCLSSLIPSIGTGLVWVPVSAGLALTGRPIAALVLALIGVFVVSTIDNVLRPVFAHFGEIQLSTFVLFLAIFGGLAAFGAGGLLLGPLLVRLGKEALEILHDARVAEKGEAAHGGAIEGGEG